MVYEWHDKQEICYRLYVEERKSLDEVMKYMKDLHDFDPSKRAFQTQFRRWNFPSKHHPAHRNQALVSRIHQLWEANITQKDMLDTLNAEGFDVKERELMRVRAKNRWLLRVPNGTKSFGPTVDVNQEATTQKLEKSKKRRRSAAQGSQFWKDDQDDSMDADMKALEQSILDENTTINQNTAEATTQDADENEDSSPDELAPDILQQRQQRLSKLQADSAELWATKKRRRRTRGWAGLPADPPGPPRFPSETTIDESKAFLHMNNELYREMRDQFQTICEEAGFIKKTVAGPEKWQTAKDRLVAENLHLNREFFGPFNGVPNESKSLALDVVCTDVTKRMRTMERRMTIADAKNILHVNPEESRNVRNEYYEILKTDHFTSKLEAGDEHWKELKNQWISASSILTELLKDGEADPKYTQKLKAIEILARDVMKRLRDDQTKRDPSRKKQKNFGPGPGPAPPRVAQALPNSAAAALASAPTASMMPVPSPNSKIAALSNDHPSQTTNDALQIDPSLLAAAADPLLAEQLQRFTASEEANSAGIGVGDIQGSTDATSAYSNSLMHAAAAAAAAVSGPEAATAQSPTPTAAHPGTIAALFRLSPLSPVQSGARVWLGKLHSWTVTELRERAMQDRTAAEVLRVEAVVAGQDEGDGGDDREAETLFTIDHDDELVAYLNFVVGSKGKAQFVVHLGHEFAL